MSGKPFDLDTLAAIMLDRDYTDGFFDCLFASSNLLGRIELESRPIAPSPAGALYPTLFGVPVQVSPIFPMTTECAACNGSGAGGDEATYCPKCDGAGVHHTEGMIRNGKQTIMLQSALPKKFAPHWPADVPLPRRPATRSRSLPYPERHG